MIIRNVAHKGLRRFIERDDPSGLAPTAVERLRNMATFLLEMKSVDELSKFPHWKPHRLIGTRKGVWSLSVTANWRLTFRVDETNGEIYDLDYVDYH